MATYKATPLAKLLVLGVVIGLGWGIYTHFAPSAPIKSSVVPQSITLPSGDGEPTTLGSSATYTDPGDTPASSGTPVRMLGYAWNAQMGLMYANGGPTTTSNSIMAKYGVNLTFQRQDDNDKLQNALVSFADQLSKGDSQPTNGANFVAIMGDGSASFLYGLNKTLSKYGPDYQAIIVDAIGYSHGEDKFMGPADWKINPQASQGGVVAGVIRDGDWNIAQKWLADNGLRTNPDEKTYDPNALNWVNASDYIDAVSKYISGYSEDRPVVVNGKPTGQTKHITVQGLVTWTPGDVDEATKKGGLVSIVSTREYSTQMPCVIIGIKKWCHDNAQTVEGFIKAAGEGGEAVKTNDQALSKAGDISQACYQEQSADGPYWVKYYKGVQQVDAQNQIVDLGGSSASSLKDTLFAFGLLPGSADSVSATYTVFGEVDTSQYPEIMPTLLPADQVIDKTFLKAVAGSVDTSNLTAVLPHYDSTKQVAHVVARRIWRIQFLPGKSTFTPETLSVLEHLRQQLLVAQGTLIEIHGHTDNQGSESTSMPLSEARAFAVAHWLEHKNPANFPESRIRVFAHGDSQPLVPNTSAANRAKNRRVEIVIGTTS